ncbi:MAG: hypothetical protein ACYDCO_21680 [Armatimonadota bacterium]
MTEYGSILILNDVFPTEHYSYEYLLDTVKDLSRTDTLLWCGRLNSIISNPFNTNHANNQRIAGGLFLTEEQAKRASEVIIKREGIERNTLFFRGQLLELIRICSIVSVDSDQDGRTYEDPLVRERFVKAALMAGELWSNLTYRSSFTEGGIEVNRRRLAASFRKAIGDNNDATHPVVAFTRGYELFSEYLPKYFLEFNDIFHRVSGLTIDEYYTAFILITYFFYSHLLKDKMDYQDKTGLFSLEHLSHFFEGKEYILQNFLVMEAQNVDELRERFIHYDIWTGEGSYYPSTYRAIRDRPMIYTEDGRAIVLDLPFFSSRATVNPLFSIRPYRK